MVILGISETANILNFFVIGITLLMGLVILIQRGKGGGLVGAFGGPGGSSAFGSRAGDSFTKFTLILAAVWVALIVAQVRLVKNDIANPENAITAPNE